MTTRAIACLTTVQIGNEGVKFSGSVVLRLKTLPKVCNFFWKLILHISHVTKYISTCRCTVKMMCGLSIELWREMIYSRPNTKLLNISLLASGVFIDTESTSQ